MRAILPFSALNLALASVAPAMATAPMPPIAELTEAVALPDQVPERWTLEPNADRTPEADAPPPTAHRYSGATFSHQAGTVGWELAGIAAAITATRIKDVTKGGSSFHFTNEGWFGRKTKSLGMDKLHHGWKTFVITDVLQSLIEKRTGDERGAIYTSAILGLGAMTYAELLDGFTARTGFSNQDMIIHVAGTGMSVVRNVVPGMKQKLDFRMEIKPQSFARSLTIVDQLSERKYLFAAQLAGFKRFEDTPWRFVELHVGYYGRGFTERERNVGDPLRRKIYVGVGLNVQSLFARRPKTRLVRLAKRSFDYIQVPYTSLHN